MGAGPCLSGFGRWGVRGVAVITWISTVGGGGRGSQLADEATLAHCYPRAFRESERAQPAGVGDTAAAPWGTPPSTSTMAANHVPGSHAQLIPRQIS